MRAFVCVNERGKCDSWRPVQPNILDRCKMELPSTMSNNTNVLHAQHQPNLEIRRKRVAIGWLISTTKTICAPIYTNTRTPNHRSQQILGFIKANNNNNNNNKTKRFCILLLYSYLLFAFESHLKTKKWSTKTGKIIHNVV